MLQRADLTSQCTDIMLQRMILSSDVLMPCNNVASQTHVYIYDMALQGNGVMIHFTGAFY